MGVIMAMSRVKEEEINICCLSNNIILISDL